MKSLFLLVVLVVCTFCGVFSQRLVVLGAHDGPPGGPVFLKNPRWYYDISVLVEGGHVTFDSIYVKGRRYTLSDTGTVTEDENSKNTFIIDLGTNEYAALHPKDPYGEAGVTPLRTYNGKALIVYTSKGKKHLLLVKEMPTRMLK